MLYGDFKAGMEDDIWQVIPTAWVQAAQDRWEPREQKGPMEGMGVDVARGGRDETTIGRRHGNWFDEIIRFPGTSTPDGPSVAGQVVTARRDDCPAHIDIIGPGASVYDFLKDGGCHAVAVNSSVGTQEVDQSHKMRFFNYRTQIWWRLREELDPANDTGIALPPGSKLRADLCTPLWSYRSGGVLKVELKEETKKRLGRSPDEGDCIVYTNIRTARRKGGRGSNEPYFVTHH